MLVFLHFVEDVVVVFVVEEHFADGVGVGGFEFEEVDFAVSEVEEDGGGIGLYFVELAVVEGEDAGGEGDRVEVHRIVLYYQPAVPVVVAVLLLAPESHQVLPEPLADLHHERNRPEQRLLLHGCDDQH